MKIHMSGCTVMEGYWACRLEDVHGRQNREASRKSLRSPAIACLQATSCAVADSFYSRLWLNVSDLICVIYLPACLYLHHLYFPPSHPSPFSNSIWGCAFPYVCELSMDKRSWTPH